MFSQQNETNKPGKVDILGPGWAKATSKKLRVSTVGELIIKKIFEFDNFKRNFSPKQVLVRYKAGIFSPGQAHNESWNRKLLSLLPPQTQIISPKKS